MSPQEPTHPRQKLRNGRKCRVAGLKMEAGEIASIEEKQLEGCLR